MNIPKGGSIYYFTRGRITGNLEPLIVSCDAFVSYNGANCQTRVFTKGIVRLS